MECGYYANARNEDLVQRKQSAKRQTNGRQKKVNNVSQLGLGQEAAGE